MSSIDSLQRDTLENCLIYTMLREAGIIDENQIELYAPRVRDRDDIKVYRCKHSGVIFLDRTDHINLDHYIEKTLSDWSFTVGEKRLPFLELQNAERQAAQFGHLIEGKSWLDFGCGAGGLLQILGSRAASAQGVEPTLWYADPARAAGLRVVSSLGELGEQQFDLITLFHVFEHLPDPIEVAKLLRRRLKPGGTLLIEVPHARDFLLGTLDCAEFRAFSLWSEHLLLHTRDSLKKILEAAGFTVGGVQGIQRFPLSNHLYWLRHGQHGGHAKWGFIDSPDLIKAYEASLNYNDATDTIVAFAHA